MRAHGGSCELLMDHVNSLWDHVSSWWDHVSSWLHYDNEHT